MKRPIPIYFIASWSFLVLTVQSRGLVRVAEFYLSDSEDVNHSWGSFRGLLLILVVWHVVRLIKLKPFNRWLSVVSFVWATISVIYFMLMKAPKMESPFIVIAASSVSGLLSLTSGLYLAHPRVREYAVRFVAEREKEKNSRMMQKAAQERIMSDLKS